MNKTQEITKMMHEGFTAAQCIAQGYKRGLVYKVNRTLHKSPQSNGNHSKSLTPAPSDKADTNIESDPEIMELKKSLRKAELEREIAEIKIPEDMESRMIVLEEKAVELEEYADILSGDIHKCESELKASPLFNLHSRFECECGNKGLLAVKVHCTVCNKEKSYGW